MARLLSGLVLAAAALAAILLLPTVGLRLLASGVAGLAAVEYLRLAGGPRRDPVVLFVAVACWWLAVPDRSLLGLTVLTLGLVALEVLFKGQSIQQAAARYFAVAYIALPLGLLVATHALAGREGVLLLIFTIVVSDSAQYYSGRLLGRRLLAPAISPKKTVEGALGGLVVGTAFVVLAGRVVFPFVRPVPLAALGVGLVLVGIAGDLFESRLKRTAGVKDSAALIPGHGGLLDRIDALLLASPLFYFFVHEVM